MLAVTRVGVILIVVCIYPTYALYFPIEETQKKCFTEEIPEDTRVVGKYRVQLWDKSDSSFLQASPSLGMHVEIKDADAKVILSRQYGSDDWFTFASRTPGEHQICLHPNSTKMALFAGGKLKVHLDIQVGERANNYPEIAVVDNLTELQLRVRQLQLQVEQILKEQNYQRYREERFRMISKSTNQRVRWWSIALISWSIAQMLTLIITDMWQTKHLKSVSEDDERVYFIDIGVRNVN
ncbi:transmembrane emp24 domain-containing protein 4-like isoform X2 [Dunckerocampus dactyliophorus]|uniref:transmembrane emp24 domain-containing protein 4-like isoform X2 n=1 Tax=Dunckerocampus dactyliophorus TaxID=161453 RepID=UPI0024067712|nr:transmembrane emp24 domain-containing protein 4-like isoform X2 [Dunckerocampus dactyliophorus]